MLSTFETQASPTIALTQKNNTRHTCIFICQLMNGKYVIGSARNASKRISALNSGLNPAVKKSQQIYRIIGIKDITEERTLPSVAKRFCEKYGDERIIVI